MGWIFLYTDIYTCTFLSFQTKALLEERNNSLMEQVQRLKEDSRNAENRRNTLDADHRRLQAQHAEVVHKLSFAEAQLQLLQKVSHFACSRHLFFPPFQRPNH